MALVSDVLEWLQALPQPALVGATGALVFAECTIGLGFIAVMGIILGPWVHRLFHWFHLEDAPGSDA